MSQVRIPANMSAEQISATADLIRARNESRDDWSGSFGMWLFFSIVVLLAFRCKDVTLWSLQARQCSGPSVAATVTETAP